MYGISDIQKCTENHSAAVNESRAIRESIEKIASLKDKALLSSFGFQVDSESGLSESQSEWETEAEMIDKDKESSGNDLSLVPSLHCCFVHRESTSYQDICIQFTDNTRTHDVYLTASDSTGHEQQTLTDRSLPDPHNLFDVLKLFSFNWFEFVAFLKSKFIHMTEDALGQCLVDFGSQLSSLNLDEKDMKTAERSRQAFLLSERAFKSSRVAPPKKSDWQGKGYSCMAKCPQID